jgi:hypothetical protein
MGHVLVKTDEKMAIDDVNATEDNSRVVVVVVVVVVRHKPPSTQERSQKPVDLKDSHSMR